jgi:hypothetical protein
MLSMLSTTQLPRNAPPLPVLNRTAFTMSRALEFFTEKELAMQLGFPPHQWHVAILKELLDNAFDACESAGVAPDITVIDTPQHLTVTKKRREAPAFMPGMDRRWARRAQCPRAQQDPRSA